MTASKDLDTPLRSRWFMFRTRWSEKRILGLIAALVGLVAGILILIAATAGQGVSLLTAIVAHGSAERLAEFLDGRRDRVEDALQVVDELLGPVLGHRPFRRRLDEAFLL